MDADQKSLETELEEELAEDDENIEKTSSSFKYVKIAKQTSSSVVLEWKYDNDDDPEKVFKVVTLKNRDEWDTICWSRKSSCTIKNLEPNTCYSIKIQVMIAKEEKFEVVDSSEIIKCSIQVVPSHKTFIRAVQKSEISLVKSYLEIMPEFITLTFRSFSALCIAVTQNDLNVAKFLLDQGAEVNIGIPALKRTNLHVALFHGFLEMADLLVSYKAEVRAKDILGLNAAHHAIDSNNLAAVEYCIATLGIHTETKDNNGYTLLLRAIVCHADLSIVRYLLSNSASQAVRDNTKISVLQHVRMIGSQELIEILLNFKPKKSDAKQKMKHNVQKLIMSRQLKKDEDEGDEGDETTSQAVSALEQNSVFNKLF